MNKLLLLFLLGNFSSLFLVAGDKSTASNEYVKINTVVKEHSLKAGAKGTLLFTFIPKKGIHINIEQPMSLKLDSAALVSRVGDLVVPQSAKKEIMNDKKPVKQAFTISTNVNPGEIHIKGILTYFYCSDEEGWCSRFKQPIDVTLTIKK